MDDVDGGSKRQDAASNRWTIFSKRVPKSKVIYFSQIAIIYIVVLVSLINLSIQENNHSLWSSLLSACIGYALPAPQFKEDEEESGDDVLPDDTEQ